MFVKFHERLKDSEKGFTLIELLVVILIIAILAAIAIPVFLNQRKKGWRAQSESFLKDAATSQESYGTANNGTYTNVLAELEAEGFNPPATTTGLVISVQIGTGTSLGQYCLTATHSKFVSGAAGHILTFWSENGVPEEANTCTGSWA